MITLIKLVFEMGFRAIDLLYPHMHGKLLSNTYTGYIIIKNTSKHMHPQLGTRI